MSGTLTLTGSRPVAYCDNDLPLLTASLVVVAVPFVVLQFSIVFIAIVFIETAVASSAAATRMRARDMMRCVVTAEGADVVLKRSLVLEIGTAYAEPKPAAVLLMGAPVASHREGLAATPAREWPRAVLPLVVRLQRAEVFERPRSRVLDVVPAPRRAAVAR